MKHALSQIKNTNSLWKQVNKVNRKTELAIYWQPSSRVSQIFKGREGGGFRKDID